MKNVFLIVLLAISFSAQAQTILSPREKELLPKWSYLTKQNTSVEIARREDMGYSFSSNGVTVEFPFSSRVERVQPIKNENGDIVAWPTVFRVGNTELTVVVEYKNNDFWPAQWRFRDRKTEITNI